MFNGFLKKTISFFMAAVLLFLSGCTLPGTGKKKNTIPDSTQGEDLTMGAAADDVFSLNCNTGYSFNPLIATNHSNQLVCALVYENLVELDNRFTAVPNIITEWTYDESATVWTLTYDTKKTFHDGSPITARDICYSIERSVNSDRYRGRFRSFQGASPKGEDKVVVMLGIGNTQLINLLNIPLIKYGSYEEKYPQGTGPYTFVLEEIKLLQETENMTAEEKKQLEKDNKKIIRSQKPLSLKAYSGYDGYKNLPIDTVYIKEYDNAEDIINAFEDSYIDVVINDPSSYTNLGYASTNEVHTYPTTNMHFIGFNQESDLGRISGFRFAMQYAFDREYLISLLNGNAVDSAIPMYPTCESFPTELNSSLKFDIAKAKIILENNGFHDYDNDGMLEAMNGSENDLEINFILCSDSSAKAGIANRFVQDMLTIGVKVNVLELTWDDYYNAITDYERLTKEQKEDEKFKPIKYDMYYGEVKLRNDFDFSELMQERTDNNKVTNVNFTHSVGDGWEPYMFNYLASGDTARKNMFSELCVYTLTTVVQFVVIGFEKQQIITHRGAIRGIDANLGNPLYGFKDWIIQLVPEEK